MAKRKSKKNNLATGARLLLGAVLVFFGLNGIFQFMPMPPLPDAAAAFMGAIMATGYMWWMIVVVKLATGLMLLLNKYTELALVLLAPLSVNIVLFHLFLDLSGGLAAYVVGTLNLYLLWVNKEKYHEICGCR